MSNYKCRIKTEIDEKKWNDVLKNSKYSTFFQTYEYLKSNSESSFPIFIEVLNDNNDVVGQLGMKVIGTTVLYSSPIFKKITRFVSSIMKRGIWVYGPIIHTTDSTKRLEILQEILKAVDDISDKYNLVHVEGQTPPLDSLIDDNYKNIFTKSQYSKYDFVTFVTNLNSSIDDIWQGVSRKTRGDVIRAQKRNIIAKEMETQDELKKYLLLNQEWARSKGLVITEPLHDMDSLWNNHIKGNEKFFLAFDGEKLISGIRVGCFNDICYTNFVINSYLDSTNLGGTLLSWFVIEWAKKNNMSIYDFSGGQKSNSAQINSLLFYKSKWGGKETPYFIFIKPYKKFSYKLYLFLFNLVRKYHKFKMKRLMN